MVEKIELDAVDEAVMNADNVFGRPELHRHVVQVADVIPLQISRLTLPFSVKQIELISKRKRTFLFLS